MERGIVFWRDENIGQFFIGPMLIDSTIILFFTSVIYILQEYIDCIGKKNRQRKQSGASQ